MWSSVDLPAPDGATIATSSPLFTSRSALSSTRTAVSPLPKCAVDPAQREMRAHSYRSASTGSYWAARQAG